MSKWVWTGANGNYLVGTFDGKRFTPEVMTQAGHAGANYYAVQTFSNLPGNRRVQMAWMQGGKYPGMPFNQQMSCPYEFKLRKYGFNSYHIFALPIREIESLRGEPRTWRSLVAKPGENPLAGMKGDLWDIVAEIEPAAAKQTGFKVRGHTIAYTVKDKARDNSLASANLSGQMGLRNGRFALRVLVDRTSIEVFGNDGEVAIPSCFLPDDDNLGLELFASGGAAKVTSLAIYPMSSAWRR